jgi:phosphatidylglycerophosphatase A
MSRAAASTISHEGRAAVLELKGRGIVRITPRFVLAHPAHFVSLGFGTGVLPAAGTFGTLVGFPLYWLLAAQLTEPYVFGVIVALFVLGVWACDVTGRHLGVSDHNGMCWDEVVAFMLVLMLTPDGWAWQAFAFFAFRFFDVVKPPPIRHFDRSMKGGLGVMFDDILAAAYTLLLMAVVKQMLSLA